MDDCVKQFDLIIVSSVLHHLPEYTGTLKKVIGLLNPGGYVYITHEPTGSALSKDKFLRKILWQVDNIIYSALMLGRRPKVAGRDYKFSDYHLYHGFDEESVKSVCCESGLDIVKFERYASAMRLGISCWLDSFLLKSKSQFCLIAKRRPNSCL